MPKSKNKNIGANPQHVDNLSKLYAINSGHVIKSFFYSIAECGDKIENVGWGYQDKSKSANWCTKCQEIVLKVD